MQKNFEPYLCTLGFSPGRCVRLYHLCPFFCLPFVCFASFVSYCLELSWVLFVYHFGSSFLEFVSRLGVDVHPAPTFVLHWYLVICYWSPLVPLMLLLAFCGWVRGFWFSSACFSQFCPCLSPGCCLARGGLGWGSLDLMRLSPQLLVSSPFAWDNRKRLEDECGEHLREPSTTFLKAKAILPQRTPRQHVTLPQDLYHGWKPRSYPVGERIDHADSLFFLLALSHQSSLNLNIGYGSLSHKPIINNTICLINNSPWCQEWVKKVAAWLACNLFHVFSQSWDLSRAGADGRLLWRAVTLCGLGLMLIFWAQATPRAAMEAASEGHSVHDPVVRPLFVRFWKNRSHIDIASMI